MFRKEVSLGQNSDSKRPGVVTERRKLGIKPVNKPIERTKREKKVGA